MSTTPPLRPTSDEIQQVRRDVMANVSIHRTSSLLTLEDFYFDYDYDGKDAIQILRELGILNWIGEPTRRWDRDKFFERILCTASKPGKLPVLYRYEYHLTKRGVHFLDRILKKADCKPYPYKRRK